MIVSHEHKFVFLKTRKTAGTSVELALSQLCGPEDVVTPISLTDQEEAMRGGGRGPQNWRVHSWWRSPRPLFKRRWFKVGWHDYGYHQHMGAEQARALLGEKAWRDYFKFAFDRNPWDRQVSYYHFRSSRKSPLRWPTFRDHILHDPRARLKNFEIYSIDGDVCVDFVGKYENLEEDFRSILGQIGVDLSGTLPRARAGTRKDKAHYTDYYDPETREIVQGWYHREIALLGYNF